MEAVAQKDLVKTLNEKLGVLLWEELQRKIVFGADVRAAMAYVESGNADLAFVYQTDATVAAGLDVIDVVPADSYSRIVYPALLLNGSSDAANEFFEFLGGDEASAIFAARGFSVPEGD